MSDLDNGYLTDDASGANWTLMLGDSCERLAEIPDNSVGLSVYSPPFASLFTYSASPRDLGNSASRGEFIEHYRYIIRENLRVTMPGRLACVHVQQLTTSKATNGYMGLTDFRGEVIRAYQDEGWIFYGEVTVDKCPQAQAIRTKSHALMFVTKNRDSSGTRPALADYVLMFKKPGDNPTPIKNDVSNDEWIEWARPIWKSGTDGEILAAMEDEGMIVPRPAWYDIKETDTLNERIAREDKDERHLCPLQLSLIDRCVRLWSNKGETVLDPFGGIGSTGVVAIGNGRRAVLIELKKSYWATAVKNMQEKDRELALPTLFD